MPKIFPFLPPPSIFSSRPPRSFCPRRPFPPLFSLLLLAVTASIVMAVEAPPQELYSYDGLTLHLTLSNQVDVTLRGGAARVDELTANLLWWPRETYRQHVVRLATMPVALQDSEGYHFTWTKPRSFPLRLELRAIVETSDDPFPVGEKALFPIASMPSDVARYTEFGTLVDINEGIEHQALRLAAGKDDLFEVVYTVADWVTTNINYSLSSVAAEATKPSTWVYENREGVCDEMTALFLSMLRSLGIPARFVSGISYTNLPEFAEPWGSHGWAEVWFPRTGWVPFDVTYGTYGYVDATHIKLAESLDAGRPSIDFTMRAVDATMLTRSISSEVEVVGKRQSGKRLFTVTMEPFSDVSLDSYNMVTATVKNEQPHYLSARFQLARTDGLELVGEHRRNLLLKPHESKSIRYIVRTRDLKEGYWYELPVKLYVGLEEVGSTAFQARKENPSYSSEFFARYLELPAERRYDASFRCRIDPATSYLGSSLEAQCTVSNDGASFLHGVQVCLFGCERLDLDAGEERTVSFPLRCDEPGAKALLATARGRLIDEYALLRHRCIDEAAVVIEGLEAPASIAFRERGDLSFTVRKTSDTVPLNVSILIAHDNFRQEWRSDDLYQPQRFTYSISGADLDLSGNEIVIIVRYKDELGKSYIDEERLIVHPAGFTFWEKLQVRMLEAQRWIEGLA